MSLHDRVAIQVVPKDKEWTSAFGTCGGGYLASDHIGLLGLTRFAREPSLHDAENDWSTAVNVRFQRGKDTVERLLAWGRHGMCQLLQHL